MPDLTSGCLEDLSKQAGKKVSEMELRQTFCQACRNHTCDYAKLANLEWEQRMRTQVDRMFGPLRQTASLDDPRWKHMRAIDFPSLIREAIRLEVADRRGDWMVPGEDEGLDMLVDHLPMDEESVEDRSIVEDAVKALRKEWGDGSGPSHDEETEGEAPVPVPVEDDEGPEYRVIEVESESNPGTIYEVSLDDDGKAVACTCNAGKYDRKCKHLSWAERILTRQAQFQDQVKDLGDPFYAPAPPKPSQESEPERSPSPQTPPSPSEPRQPPRLQNVPVHPGGQMVDGGPARSLLPSGDPWSPKNAVRKVESGVRITVGKKDD